MESINGKHKMEVIAFATLKTYRL